MPPSWQNLARQTRRGPSAAYGSLAATNLVGVDILPIMGNTNLAAGSQGFTPPLSSGDYAFLIQQTGAAQTSYEFDYVVTAVPEPSTFVLIGLGAVSLLAAAKPRRRCGMLRLDAAMPLRGLTRSGLMRARPAASMKSGVKPPQSRIG